MKSILQDKKMCFICGASQPLEEHHLFNGAGFRKKSEQDGLKIYLCKYCHDSVHLHSEQRYFLKKIGQRKYLENHSFDEYMKRYKKNYLDDDETLIETTINEIERNIETLYELL